jgi:nitrogen-specific signal transduction histidine kinase
MTYPQFSRLTIDILNQSLSYDIINAHSGELKLDSTEAESATFRIFLPLD